MILSQDVLDFWTFGQLNLCILEPSDYGQRRTLLRRDAMRVDRENSRYRAERYQYLKGCPSVH